LLSVAGVLAVVLIASGCGHTIDVGGGPPPGPPPGPEFAYVSNSGDGVVSELKIDAKSGNPSFIDQVSTGAKTIQGMAATPGLLYVASPSDSQIFGFRINAKNGTLTPTAQGSVNTGSGTAPVALAISLGGSFLYAVDDVGNQVFQYSINKSDGALKAIAGPVPTGNKPVTLAIAPTGQSLFVGNQGDGTIFGFSIARNGALTNTGSIGSLGGTTGAPQWLSNDPAGGPDLFNADADGGPGGSVVEFTIAGAKLNPVGVFGTGNASGAPVSVAVDPVIPFVYTGNFANNNGSKFQILANGLSTATLITSLPSPSSVAVDQTGAFFFAADQTDALVFFGKIDQTTGDVTLSPGGPIDTESPPNGASAPFQILTIMTPSS
jgi:6-phosphogluconolactonase (cycloisomerase 2 family)